MALTPKQERFAQEYLIDLNATQAATRAGYSERTAQEQSSRLLSNAMVQARVAELQAARSERTQIKADDVLREIAALAYSDIGDIIDYTGDEPRLKPARDIPARARRTISSVKVKRYLEKEADGFKPVEVLEFKLWSKPESLRDLGRHLKLFTDNVHIDNLDELIERELARVATADQGATAGTAPAAEGPE